MYILFDAGFLGIKSLGFLLEQNHKLGKTKDPLLSKLDSCRCLVGCLIYLTNTQPNMAYSMQILSQFMHQLLTGTLDAALRIFRYIKSTSGQGILLHADFLIYNSKYIVIFIWQVALSPGILLLVSLFL